MGTSGADVVAMSESDSATQKATKRVSAALCRCSLESCQAMEMTGAHAGRLQVAGWASSEGQDGIRVWCDKVRGGKPH